MLGQERHERGRGQRHRRPIGEDAPGHGVGQQHGEEPQRQQRAAGQRIERREQRVVERRLMELVADWGDAEVGREVPGFDLFQVGVRVVPHVQHRKVALFDQVARIVVVRRLIGGLPGRRVDGEQGA